MASNYPFGNDPAKVAKYQAFWNRHDVTRPLVGFSFKTWFPLDEYAASAAWKSADVLTPDMVDPEAFMDDQERLLQEGETIDDDIFRGASPSQAVPWLPGMLGGRLRILPGSVLCEDRALGWDELEHVVLDRENPWYRKYIEFAETLVKRSAECTPLVYSMAICAPEIFLPKNPMATGSSFFSTMSEQKNLQSYPNGCA